MKLLFSRVQLQLTSVSGLNWIKLPGVTLCTSSNCFYRWWIVGLVVLREGVSTAETNRFLKHVESNYFNWPFVVSVVANRSRDSVEFGTIDRQIAVGENGGDVRHVWPFDVRVTRFDNRFFQRTNGWFFYFFKTDFVQNNNDE